MFVIMSAAIKISFCFLDLLILAWGMKELYKKLIISNASEKKEVQAANGAPLSLLKAAIGSWFALIPLCPSTESSPSPPQ